MKSSFSKKILEIKSGILDALPIAAGLFSVGVPFGILATKVQMPFWAIFSMSTLVFGASSQFIALQMILSGAALWSIILTTFVVNFRHFLMAMSLGSLLPRSSTPLLSYIAQSIGDESYALNLNLKNYTHPMRLLGVNLMGHIAWISSCSIGALLGHRFEIKESYLRGALPAMFVTLVVLQIHKPKDLFVFALASLCCLIISQYFPGCWPLLITAFLVPSIMTIWEACRG